MVPPARLAGVYVVARSAYSRAPSAGASCYERRARLPRALALSLRHIGRDLLHVRGRRAVRVEQLLERGVDDFLRRVVVLKELPPRRIATLHRLERDIEVDVREVRPRLHVDVLPLLEHREADGDAAGRLDDG